IEPTLVPEISAAAVLDGLPEDGPEGDSEARIGALIERAMELLGEHAFLALRQQSLDPILIDIREDLGEFGVEFDRWFSERSLTDDQRIDEALEVLKSRDMLYQKDGAWWFRATDFGDEK